MPLSLPMPSPSATATLLPALQALCVSYNPLRSQYIEEGDRPTSTLFGQQANGSTAKVNDVQNANSKHRGHEGNDNHHGNVETVAGPLAHIQVLDLSGVNTEELNVCSVLVQFQNLKVTSINI